MPMLVIGNNKNTVQQGFTLLEITLVLAIIVTLASISVPYLFRSDADVLHDEARLLMQKLRLAATETQFTGRPMRCKFFIDYYVFEQWDIDGSWLASEDDSFAKYRFSNLRIDNINTEDEALSNDVSSSTESVFANDDTDSNANNNAADNNINVQKPLGRIIFFPDGMLSFADITLRSKQVQIQIKVRPGPGGISLIKENKSDDK